MYNIINYKAEYEKQWDTFVMEHSVNGTFLQTRRFLNYHPKNRFSDVSVLIYDKETIEAVCLACAIDNNKTFYSLWWIGYFQEVL